jgi:signal peptide peptidase SppA
MKIDKLLSRLCLEGGSRILAIHEARALHAGDIDFIAAETAKAPTSVAVVPLVGSLYPSDLSAFASRIDAAAANADVGHIVIPVDSPGGTVSGTPEAAAAVARAQAIKPVSAHIGSLGASAAYWIASQAGSISMNPSAEAGSIGVLAVHSDLSKMFGAAGITHTIIRSTPHKAEGSILEPLSEEAKIHLQGLVDETHDDFVRAVAAGRKVSMAKVNSDFGQGRTMGAAKAIAGGMADKTASLGEVLQAARSRVASTYRRRTAGVPL